MKAQITLDVPEWQIGQDVTVIFRDTMVKHGRCELLKEQEAQKFFVDESGKITPLPVVVRCKDCKNYNIIGCSEGFGWCEKYGSGHTDDWFCADGERRNE